MWDSVVKRKYIYEAVEAISHYNNHAWHSNIVAVTTLSLITITSSQRFLFFHSLRWVNTHLYTAQSLVIRKAALNFLAYEEVDLVQFLSVLSELVFKEAFSHRFVQYKSYIWRGPSVFKNT